MRLRLALLVVLLTVVAPRLALAGKGVEGVVNLNTAPPEVLALLPGVGPAKATAILSYRRRRPFRTVDELVRIKGIGRKMVRRLRPHLAIAGPTTASAASGGPPAAAPPPVPVHPPTPVRPAGALHCPPPRPTGPRNRDRPPPAPLRSSCLRPR